MLRILNNYSPKARRLSGNIYRDEVEVNIPRKSPSVRRIIVLVFLHIEVNIRYNCPSLYTKVIFLHRSQGFARRKTDSYNGNESPT